MKRFWREVSVLPADGGWQVALDGRPLRTQGGAAQVVPGPALAELLASEWRNAGEEVDPRAFVMRDLADLAIDRIAADPGATIAGLLAYAETDTLLYRADPEDPLHRHQLAQWEPLVRACEARHGVVFQRVAGIMHRPQPPATLAALRARLERESPFTLAGLAMLAPIGASLITALAVLEDGAEPAALFAAAHLEADWQAEHWGEDAEAQANRAARLAAFEAAAGFVRAAKVGG